MVKIKKRFFVFFNQIIALLDYNALATAFSSCQAEGLYSTDLGTLIDIIMMLECDIGSNFP